MDGPRSGGIFGRVLTARKKGLPEPLAPTPSAAKLPIVLAAHAAIRPAAPTHGFRIADEDFRPEEMNALGLTVRVVLVAKAGGHCHRGGAHRAVVDRGPWARVDPPLHAVGVHTLRRVRMREV